YLERCGLNVYGTRTLREMTERLLAAAADAREAPLDLTAAALIDSFTLVRTSAPEAVRRVCDLLRPQKIDIGPALVAFKRRLDLLQSHGVDTRQAQFSAVFGRSLEYYTGFVFQAISRRAQSPVGAGMMGCWRIWERPTPLSRSARASTRSAWLPHSMEK